MTSLKMAGVDLRSLVRKDEPDLVFLDGKTAAMLLKDDANLTYATPRQYRYWLMTVDPIEFIEKDILTKPFLHPRLIREKASGPITAPHYYNLEIVYQWGWIIIEFTDQKHFPLPFEDETDALLVNPNAFTREQKLFYIKIDLAPTWMSQFMRDRENAGDNSYTTRLIDMDLIEIAIKYKDAYFYGTPENCARSIFRPGRHIKGFQNAADTWIFQSEITDKYGHPWGEDTFFALRKRLPGLNAIYAVGDDAITMPWIPPFSGSSMDPFSGTDSENLGEFALFRGRNPEDLFKPDTGPWGPRYRTLKPD